MPSRSRGKGRSIPWTLTSEDSVQTYTRSRQPVPETMPGDVAEQQNHHAFWKIRDKKGWKHGIIVNGNRQHWKCKYCFMIGRSSGLSGLKSHLVGDRRKAKKCLAVPEDVSPAFITSSKPWDLIPSTSHGLISDVQKDYSSILRELEQGSMVLAHVPGGTCYCSFCTDIGIMAP